MQRLDDALARERLRHIIDDANLQAGHRRVEVLHAGQHDNRRVGVRVVKLLRKPQAIRQKRIARTLAQQVRKDAIGR